MYSGTDFLRATDEGLGLGLGLRRVLPLLKISSSVATIRRLCFYDSPCTSSSFLGLARTDKCISVYNAKTICIAQYKIVLNLIMFRRQISLHYEMMLLLLEV